MEIFRPREISLVSPKARQSQIAFSIWGGDVPQTGSHKYYGVLNFLSIIVGPNPSPPLNGYRNIPLEIPCTEMGISKPMKPITLHSRSIPPMRNSFLAIILFAALGFLSACGGGSGSGNPSDPPPAALTLSTSSLPTGQIGVAYSAVLAATGGTPPYMWSMTSGTLPAGLMLNASTGAITGTPTQTVTSTGPDIPSG